MKILTLVLVTSLIFLDAFGQVLKKEIVAIRVDKAPRIDGEAEEEVWAKIAASGDFRQFSPKFDAAPSFPTEIKVGYDNAAFYIMAFMYDSRPDSILKQLTQRDKSGNADQISISIDSYNDDQNAFVFGVTAAGVQIDQRIGANIDEDEASDFDVVWESAVKINDKGWFAEIKIPFSALRFPKKGLQNWGINFKREIRRFREEDMWNQTPATAQNLVPYFGAVTGLKNIEPPLRLFITPYLSSSNSHYPVNQAGKSNITSTYSAGADVKLGINESFTLDMTLIPDFGQVPSDPQVLNLTPYEVRFDENRDFFKEGFELFNQGGLLYPRRIGRTPGGFNRVQSLSQTGLQVYENPAQVRLLNASKLSGRAPSGLGLGVLNAITAKTEARVRTAAGLDSVIVTEPFTNYNVVALNQTLKNNSSLSFINTNVLRKDVSRNTANVTGLGFTLGNKNNSYSLEGFAALSQKAFKDDVSTGFTYNIEYGKVKGNFQFSLEQRVESDKYDPNDLGILPAPDEISNEVDLSYQTFKPKGIFLKTNTEIEFTYSSTYGTRQYQDAGVEVSSNAIFKNFNFEMIRIASKATGNDFFEARTPGRIFKRLGYIGFMNIFSTDYRKRLALDVSGGYFDNFTIRRPYTFIDVSPRYRFNDRFSLVLKHRYAQDRQQGFADKAGENIVFAERFLKTDITELEGSYGFSPNMSLSLKGRYYWSRVKNYEYKLLGNDGYLEPNTIGYNVNNDRNVNFLTADLVYRWRFAPGSDLFVVYKNNTQAFRNQVRDGYFENVRSTLNSDQQNSLNIKLLYFLDYQSFKKGVKR
jgi:hypothetical protein